MPMINSKTVSKQDLIKLGYKDHTARNLICQAKKIMVKRGYTFYDNKRLGRVPTEVVESIIGVKLHDEVNGVIEDDQ